VSDPREALARGLARQRERIAWDGDTITGATGRVIAAAKAKLDALAAAIDKYEAAQVSRAGSGGRAG
jgi:hypothetical protein